MPRGLLQRIASMSPYQDTRLPSKQMIKRERLKLQCFFMAYAQKLHIIISTTSYWLNRSSLFNTEECKTVCIPGGKDQ